MTDAELIKIERDPTLADAFLKRARAFLQDGSATGNSPASREVLLHNSAIAACDAVLAISGFEVEGSEHGHPLRLDKAERPLGGDLTDLFQQPRCAATSASRDLVQGWLCAPGGRRGGDGRRYPTGAACRGLRSSTAPGVIGPRRAQSSGLC